MTSSNQPARPPLSRRAFLRLLMGSLGLVGGGYVWHEIHALEVVPVRLQLPHWPPAFAGLTLAQLSDLHLGPFITAADLHTVVNQVLALQAEVIVLTGDFASRSTHGEPEILARELGRLTAPLGVFACLGNWEWWTDTRAILRALRSANVQLLYNQSMAWQRGAATVYIAGIDSVAAGRPSLNRALAPVPAQAPTLLLAHEPDFADSAAQDPRLVLQLSGHSHGGQVRLPGFGPVLLPRLGRKYPAGWHQIQNMQLYVNRGLGVTALPLRFNCRPEITLFTLYS